LVVLGGATPIVSVLVGDEADTLSAGDFLFRHGYYVQSVTFPAVPYHAGVLRIQVNANHLPESIDGLIDPIRQLRHTTSPARPGGGPGAGGLIRGRPVSRPIERHCNAALLGFYGLLASSVCPARGPAPPLDEQAVAHRKPVRFRPRRTGLPKNQHAGPEGWC